MKPTDVKDPDYFHKVVDCQWACPAHTNIPEYIRLIAQGKYTESYLLNRDSNVFPGILGRTCDRPCEPACRRGRVEDKPVAICRLKRVAADLKGDVYPHLPKAPTKSNGKKVCLIGAGPASLTVANDLLPLGYEITIYEALPKPGGLMRVNIPSFRLPVEVLEDEINMILGMGNVSVHYNHRIDSLKELLDSTEFDAVFIGTGAPKGKDLRIPGRKEADANIHIGIEWLKNVHFEHVESIGERVLVIGVGNTAMDCCRTSKRIGGKGVKVVARKSRKYFKASPWELEDAEEELIEILENHSPVSFVTEDGKLKGIMFDLVEWNADETGRLRSTKLGEKFVPCDDVILAIGQDNSFPWIEKDIGIEFGKWDMPVVDKTTFMTTRSGVFMGGDAAWGPENIIWAVEHGHQSAISIHSYCQGKSLYDRTPNQLELQSSKMGLHEWSYSNDYSDSSRTKMIHADLQSRFEELSLEVELGFNPEQTAREVQRCLNCDIQTEFEENKCIECDACIDICPVSCLTITPSEPDEVTLRKKLTVPAQNMDQAIYVSDALPETERLMVKDEDLCLHCGLCAERCPTAAWDMVQMKLFIPHAESNNE
jgi:NADPH-dependent glutamate synthase beta subunit-like oxidoreductase